MSGFRMVSFLTLVIATVLLIEECLGQETPRRRNNRNNRHSTRGNGGLPSDLQQAYNQAVGGQETPSLQETDDENAGSENTRSVNNLWEEYAPSTPAADDVECTFELYTLRRLNGRCTRLGGLHMPYICQRGLHFAFNQDCERIFRNRQK